MSGSPQHQDILNHTPRPFTSPGRTNSSGLSPAAHFHQSDTVQDIPVGLTTNHSSQQSPAGTATEEVPSSFADNSIGLPRNFTVSDLPPQQQTSPYVNYLYSTLNRGQGYSTTNSARTSYTRVDSMALEDNLDQEEGRGTSRDENVVDIPVEEQTQEPTAMPIVSLCFLTISGKRKVMTFEPETTIGRVKELVWSSWPTGEGWDNERPPTPSHLRILHLGRILQDEDTLKACNFPIYTPPTSPSSVVTSAPPPPTIVHLAIRPTGGILSTGDNGDLEKKKNRSRLVARFGSVLSSTEVGNETQVPPSSTTVGNGAAAPEGEDGSRGCSCCVVC